jgi:hypothetical protein
VPDVQVSLLIRGRNLLRVVDYDDFGAFAASNLSASNGAAPRAAAGKS